MEDKFYIEQLQAKEAMLASTTNYLLRTQQLLQEKNKLISDTNTDIFNSINFAQIIQQSLLPDTDVLNVYFKDSIYRVIQQIGIGGDSIFIKNSNQGITFGLLDATGHGIPATMLSISGTLILNELAASMDIDNPEVLIKLLNYRLYSTFNSGFSIAHFEGTLCFFSSKNNTLNYCSAKGKIFHITIDGETRELPCTKRSIGENILSDFDCFSIDFQVGDKLFLCSDGLTDQFGGENDKKFSKARLKLILRENYNKNVSDLDKIIYDEHLKWKSSAVQTDDISFLIIQF